MVLEFENSEEDYSKSSLELLKKYFWRSILYTSLISFILSFVIINVVAYEFNASKFGLTFIILFLIILTFNNLRSFYNIYKVKRIIRKDLLLYIGKKIIVLESDGFFYGIQKNKYGWSYLNKIENLPNYIYLIFQNKTSIVISKKDYKIQKSMIFLMKFPET